MKRRSPSRRVVVCGVWAAVFLLIGAVVNVAVAWGIVLVQKPELNRLQTGVPSYERIKRGGSEDWLVIVNPKAGYDFAHAICVVPGEPVQDRWMNQMESMYASLARRPPFEPPGWATGLTVMSAGWSPRGHSRSAFACGWPLRAMFVRFDAGDPSATTSLRITGGIVIEQDTRGSPFAPPRTLPLMPIWPAFAANSVFFGALFACVLILPLTILRLRRGRRERRRQCPACGYPVGVSAVCTECGAAVKGVAG